MTAQRLRDPAKCRAYDNSKELRAKWFKAVRYLQTRPQGSLWVLDNSKVKWQ